MTDIEIPLNKCFVILSSTADPDDHSYPCAVALTEKEAKEYIRKRNEEQDKIENLAIKNKYASSSYCSDEDDSDYVYERLLYDALFWKTKQLIPRLADNPDIHDYYDIDETKFSEEEIEIYDSLNDEDALREYMEYTGEYTKEVIDATIDYNIRHNAYYFRNYYYICKDIPLVGDLAQKFPQ